MKRFNQRVAVQKIVASHIGHEKSPLKSPSSNAPSSASPRKRPGTANAQTMFSQMVEQAKNDIENEEQK